MGLWKIVNVSAFGKPDASKIMNVSAFCKMWIRRTIFLIYIYDSVELCLGFLENSICNLDVPHDIPHMQQQQRTPWSPIVLAHTQYYATTRCCVAVKNPPTPLVGVTRLRGGLW